MIYTAFVADEQGRIIAKRDCSVIETCKSPNINLEHAEAIDALGESLRMMAKGIRVSEKRNG